MIDVRPRSRVSLIIGWRGQDGHYLTEKLCARGDHVVGLGRDSAWSSSLGDLPSCDVRDRARVTALLAEHRPDEIYYLAGVFDSSEAAARDPVRDFRRSHEVHVAGWHNFLDAVQHQGLATRLFYASSSRVFGAPAESPQTERTPLVPRCLYGITKRTGMDLARFYRPRGLFCSSGILYNHESPRRPPAFVSRKIVRAAVDIAGGSRRRLALGSLDAVVDWGAAQDYVEAMTRVLALDRPEDFIIASGERRTVRQFVEAAFGCLGLSWQAHVVQEHSLLASAPAALPVVGDASRLRAATGWQPRLGFEEMVRQMIEAERRAERPKQE